MVFNKSWSFLKQYTIENDYQTKLPMHDPRLDYTTGWEGWDPVRAVRVQGTHRPAGEPVPQDGSNINYEEGDPSLPPAIPKIPDDNDPVWNDPNSRWSKDPISNVPYYMAGAYRDGKYHPRARKLFAGLKNAKAGTWVSNNTMGDINNLYTHNAPGKLVYIRGNLDKYGKVHRRDSDEAKEDLAEAFIEHDKNIPRESLVEVPLRRHYRDQTLQMGTPNLGRNISNTDRRPSGRISRWSDKPLPWSKPIKRKQIEDMDEDELHNLFHGKTKDEIYELTKGSPMKKAFRLLKNIQEGEETGLFNMNENMLYDYFNNFNPEKQDENTERLDEYGNIIDYNEQDYEDSIKEFNRYYEKRKRDNRRYYEHENKRIEPSKERFPMSLFPEDHPEYTTRFEWKNRKLASEPMEIAFQLLKAQQTLHSYNPDSVEELLHPNKRTIVISSKPNWVNKENPMSEEKQSDLHDNLLAELGALKNKKDMKIISARGKSVEWGDEHSIALSNVPDHHFDNIMGLATKYEQDSVLHSPKGTSSGELLKPSGEVDFPLGEGGFVNDAENMTEFNTGQRFAYGEPMNIVFQLLKERKSPAAFAHKLEYDKQYQKTPKRVKYREQLNAERRKRGIYGKGGKDVSHTQGGKLTLESAHANRARHFKNKGTLRRVKVKK